MSGADIITVRYNQDWDPTTINQDALELMYKHHLDVYNLIPKGIAILKTD